MLRHVTFCVAAGPGMKWARLWQQFFRGGLRWHTLERREGGVSLCNVQLVAAVVPPLMLSRAAR